MAKINFLSFTFDKKVLFLSFIFDKMISKDVIKILIAENQREVQNKQLIERPYIIEDSLNYVFVGLRRAGKSYSRY